MTDDHEIAEQECFENYLKSYEDYDHALTAVASWREIFEFREYSSKSPCFDWFPEIRSPGRSNDPLKPDFTAFLEPGYGLVGEIKASLPLDQKGFDADLRQLASYSKIPFLLDRHGKKRELDQVDVVLSINRSGNVVQIARRIIECFENLEHPFKPPRNVIVMDHSFFSRTNRVQFQMQRVPIPGNGEFQQFDLHKHTTVVGRPINMPVERCKQHLSQFMLMNDTPKRLFLMVFLWSHVMAKKFASAPKRSPRGRPVLTLHSKALTYELNSAFFGGKIRLPTSAIDDALSAFVSIGLGRRLGKTDHFEIEYSQITRSGTPVQSLGQNPELAHAFAARLCKLKEETKKATAQQLLLPMSDLDS